MVGMLAIAAAAGWLLAFFLCAVATKLPPRWAGAAPPPGLGGERPALVNLVVTRGRLNGAAYPATILDLAAKGHLMITQRMAGQLWCDVPAAAPADTGLAQSERLALADASQLAGQGGAPFEAVAESCASDVRGKWDPFEEAVRAEGRQAGLTRPRLLVAVQAPLYIGAGVVSLLVFPAVDAVPHTSGVVAPLIAAFFAFIIPVTMVGSLSQKDRLTGHGAAIAAWTVREAADAAAGWPPRPPPGWLPGRRGLPATARRREHPASHRIRPANNRRTSPNRVDLQRAARVVLLTARERPASRGQRPARRAPRDPGLRVCVRGARIRHLFTRLTIIVKAADGVPGGLTSLARRRGRPLPEVGDEAWLLNRGRTAVLRVGEVTARVTIGGSAARSLPPGALPRLAATVAERLPAHASSQRSPG